jgi:hypothetical protein
LRLGDLLRLFGQADLAIAPSIMSMVFWMP